MKPSVNILIVLLFAISACSEVVDSEYSTLVVAKQEKAIATGLVPDWLPKSTRQIKVAYDISTNEKILTFHYKTNEGWNPLKECETVDPYYPPKPKLKRAWWPEDIPATKDSNSRHSFFTCEDGDSFLAAHPKGGEAFYWNTK